MRPLLTQYQDLFSHYSAIWLHCLITYYHFIPKSNGMYYHDSKELPSTLEFF